MVKISRHEIRQETMIEEGQEGLDLWKNHESPSLYKGVNLDPVREENLGPLIEKENQSLCP